MDRAETISPQNTTSSYKTMNLTPVPIRGKRKRKPHKNITNPPAALLELPSTAPKMKRPLSTVLSTRSLSRPTLDSLPAEILESILLYSANLSLPRASHVLGAKLSGRATLLRLFLWAFHETWDQWFGIATSSGIFIGPRTYDQSYKIVDGDPSFQSAVLGLPWVKIDFILQAQQTWADTYAKDRWYQHCFSLETTGDVPMPYGHSHNRQGSFGHFNARDCFEDDYQLALTWKPRETPGDSFGSWGTQDVHPEVRVPVDLMTGPWDDEQQRRLFWLIRAGAKAIDYHPSSGMPWEIKHRCLRNAVIDPPTPNVLVSNLLLSRLQWTDLPDEVGNVELTTLDRRLIEEKEGAETVEQKIYWLFFSDLMQDRGLQWAETNSYLR